MNINVNSLETADKIRISHLNFAEQRGLEKTYCPSEVARILFPDHWRQEMNAVRIIADQLVKEGILVVLQGGSVKNKLPSELYGPIRLRKKQ